MMVGTAPKVEGPVPTQYLPKQGKWDPSMSGIPEMSSKCPFRLHAFERTPEDPPCMSTTTHEWIAAFKRHPCYSKEPEKANVFISDVETADDSNWPSYGNKHGENFVAGRDHQSCVREEAHQGNYGLNHLPFYTRRDTFKHGVMLMPDSHCLTRSNDWDSRNIMLGRSTGTKTLMGHHIGTNAGPVQWEASALARTCAQKTNATFLFSFTGSARKEALVRSKMIELWEKNGNMSKPDILVTKSVGPTKFWEILEDSKFALAPRGTCLWSFRFQEALFAGTVPVIYADGWLPPYADVVDPASYLVQIPENDFASTEQILRNIDNEHYQKLCVNAKNLHSRYLSSHDGMLDLVLQTLKKWSESGKGPENFKMF